MKGQNALAEEQRNLDIENKDLYNYQFYEEKNKSKPVDFFVGAMT